MEASGCAVRQLPRAPSSLLRVGRCDMGVRRAGPATVYVGGGGFSDVGHLRYYARCGGKTEKKEEKKRAKLAKGLARDLSALMEGLAVSGRDGAVPDAASGNKMTINEAASALLSHLEEARSNEKAMKKQEKEMRKARKKALKMNKMEKCDDSSSSSSDSSESDCDEQQVGDMNCLKSTAAPPVKEMKKKKKCEDSSSSSSSSDSSESDCDEQQVVDMSCLRSTAAAPRTVKDVPASLAVVNPPALPKMDTTVLQIPEQKWGSTTDCCSGDSVPLLSNAVAAVASGNVVVIDVPIRHVPDSFMAEEPLASIDGCKTTACSTVAPSPQVSGAVAASMAAPMDRIEVCVGGKCKKSGSLQLMEELQRQVGAQGAVVGCKCMGKCKEGPNVRLSHQKEVGAPTLKGPLCIGVGLEDVGAIVSSYFGDQDLGLMAAAS